MTKKKGAASGGQSNTIEVSGSKDEDRAATIARMTLRPSVQAAVTLKEYGKGFGDLELSGLIDGLKEQIQAVEAGDLRRGEAMLAMQAHSLDAIFNNLAQRAIRAEYMNNLETYLKLALRAQAQCRATWEALSTIKNPPMMGYVKQANIAHGHQQVNNGAVPEGATGAAAENQTVKNKLLEQSHEQPLESGAAGEASDADKDLAPVGTRDRPQE